MSPLNWPIDIKALCPTVSSTLMSSPDDTFQALHSHDTPIETAEEYNHVMVVAMLLEVSQSALNQPGYHTRRPLLD